MRFKSKAVRLLAALIGIVQTLIYMGIVLYAPALALEAVAGLPLWMSIAIVGVVGTVYTSIGGIKSVIWTDAMQFIVMFVGIVAVLIKGTMDAGGISRVFEIGREGERFDFNVINPDPRVRHSIWSLVIGSCIMWLTQVCNQSGIQRMAAIRTKRGAVIAFLLNIPFLILFGITMCLTGLVIYAYFVTIQCDPLKSGRLSNPNQMMPYFVLSIFTNLPGFSGLHVSALFSAALSTLSSGVNGMAAITIEDIIRPRWKSMSDEKSAFVAKIISVFYGLMAVGLAYLSTSMKGTLVQMATSFIGACGGPIVGLLFLGALIPWANWIGAFAGGFLGIGISMWITLLAQFNTAKLPFSHMPPITGCYNMSTSMNMSSTWYETFNHTVLWNSSYDSSTIPSHYTPSFTDATDILQSTEAPSSLPSFIVYLYSISYIYFALLGILTTLIIGIIVSTVTVRLTEMNTDPDVLFPICRRFCPSEDHEVRWPMIPSETDVVQMSNLGLKKDLEFRWKK